MNKKGFTLLEMILVVSVLSVLFLLTVPSIQKVLAVVDEKGCSALVKVADAAIVQYRLETGDFPDDVYDLISHGYLNESQLECSNGKIIVISGGEADAR
ncbi:MAG: prepilin-type N-terminal cleavage/methylation domain-containing protein [Erysipelotrichaceae bacterium]|nr:prepilin-type N-terminal cleavage/methylation domain-containing protein [Erysipelotrichaceae bacterium]